MARNAHLTEGVVFLSGTAAAPNLDDTEIEITSNAISDKIIVLGSGSPRGAYRERIRDIDRYIRNRSRENSGSFASVLKSETPATVTNERMLARDFARLVEERKIFQDLIIGENIQFRECGLRETIIAINKKIARGSPDLRKTNISIPPQHGGRRIVFPDHKTISESIDIIEIESCRLLSRSVFLGSIYIFLAILHLHPFADGNGGTARIAMNIAMMGEGDANYFLPVQLMESIDRILFNIHERRASYLGDYRDLLKYISSYLDIELNMRGN